ncbi:NAD(P)H-dependent glycerol-3-phosphate dehydrogenase [Shimia ponticola]|uniref:NAD(P)H-dependent glycerol-3-phosphate dehydrogenase n=1 Tax=Shimia ponticola TaxID=2582893 RepID=UPI0011BEF39B|nr:NAD(P)H-dependent glycerol-3-phosphate dehydrogenase [Shimia ponticola]
MTIGIIGAGAFGSALAITLASVTDVVLWGRALNTDAKASPRLPNHPLPDRVRISLELSDCAQADLCLIATPMAGLSEVSERLDEVDCPPLILCCKGISGSGFMGPASFLAERLPKADIGVLTGPSFAVDIASGLPTALTLAGPTDILEPAQAALTTPTLRVYTTADVVGAELGGAMKNVIAIAAGIAMGAGLGESARAALITRGFAELERFALSRGAQSRTLHGLSGLGDLLLTATSEKSRNYAYGLALGAGTEPEKATVEGRQTALNLAEHARISGIDLPLTTTVAALINGTIDVTTAIRTLMSRPPKEE